MDESSLLKEIETLKSRIQKLESEKKDNVSLFGRSYSQVGSSNSDLILKTKGQVKIQWGSKFIDLVKDGAINVKSSFISKVSSYSDIGSSDGIYVLNDGSVYLVCNSTPINIVGEVGNTYISFLAEQDTTSNQKLTALRNIGFYKESLESLEGMPNGIIYSESDQKIYLVKDGTLSSFTFDMPSKTTQSFTIAKSDDNKGALILEGSGISNSLKFESAYLYADNNTLSIDSTLGTVFNVYGNRVLSITSSGLVADATIKSNNIESLFANDFNGFRLYTIGDTSYLEVDILTVRNELVLDSGSYTVSSDSTSDSAETVKTPNDYFGSHNITIRPSYGIYTYWVSANDDQCTLQYTADGNLDEGQENSVSGNPWSDPNEWINNPWYCKLWFEIMFREYIYSSNYNTATEIKDVIYKDEEWLVTDATLKVQNTNYIIDENSCIVFNAESTITKDESGLTTILPFRIISPEYSIDGIINFTVGSFIRTDQPMASDTKDLVSCSYLADIQGITDVNNIPLTRCIPQIKISNIQMVYRSNNSSGTYLVSGSSNINNHNFTVTKIETSENTEEKEDSDVEQGNEEN